MLSTEEREKIIQMGESGYSINRISKETGKDRKTIRQVIQSGGNNGDEEEFLEASEPSAEKNRGRVGRSGSSVNLKRDELEIRRLDIESRRLEKIERKLEQKEEQELAEQQRRRQEDERLRVQQEEEARREREKRGKVQRIKSMVILPELKSEIPSYILSLTLFEIELQLTKMDILNLSEDELLLHAKAIRDSFWKSNSEYSGEVYWASRRASLKALKETDIKLMEIFRDWWVGERRKFVWQKLAEEGHTQEEIEIGLSGLPPITLDEARRIYWQWLVTNYPREAGEQISNLMELCKSVGNQEGLNELNRVLSQFMSQYSQMQS